MDYKQLQYLKNCIKPLLPICLDGYFTEAEQIGKLTCAVNQLISNDEYLKNIVDDIDATLEQYVSDTLNEWLENGKIDQIMSRMYDTWADAVSANLSVGEIFTITRRDTSDTNGYGAGCFRVVSNDINLPAYNSNSALPIGATLTPESVPFSSAQASINWILGNGRNLNLVNKDGYSVNQINVTSPVTICGNGCPLIATSTTSNYLLNVNVPYDYDTGEGSMGGVTLNNIVVDMNGQTNYTAACYFAGRALHVDNLTVIHCATDGVIVDLYDGQMFNNLSLYHTTSQNDNVGLYVKRVDTYYNNVEIGNFYKGVRFAQSNDVIINNIHTWTTQPNLNSIGISFDNGPGNQISTFITDGNAYALEFLSQTDNGSPLSINELRCFTPSSITALIKATKYEQVDNVKIFTLSNFRDGTKLTNLVSDVMPVIFNYSNNIRIESTWETEDKQVTLAQNNGGLMLQGAGVHQLPITVSTPSSSFNLGQISSYRYYATNTSVGMCYIIDSGYNLSQVGYLYTDINGNVTAMFPKSVENGSYILILGYMFVPLRTY